MYIDAEKRNDVALEATAEGLRERFKESDVLCIHLIGAAGAGKTSLLEKTLAAMQSPENVAIVLGSASSEDDVRRLQRFGGYVTRAAAPFNALALFEAIAQVPLDRFDLLFLENTRDPLRAAAIDLGQHAEVMVLSVTEGEDKPLLASAEFVEAELCVINQIDLLPNVNFNVALASRNVALAHRGITVLEVSCRSGEGLDQWLRWIECRRQKEFPGLVAKD